MLVNASNNSTISGPTASPLRDYFAGASMAYQVNSVIIRKKLCKFYNNTSYSGNKDKKKK